MVGLPRQAGGVQPPHGGPGGVASTGPNGAGPDSYLANPQQAAMMQKMMAMEQEKRVQIHMMEQQKAQLMREQRQQQQQHMLAEQVSAIDTIDIQCWAFLLSVQLFVTIDKEF